MYTLMIAPLLLGGVLVAGFLLGMPGTDNGIIPSRWIADWSVETACLPTFLLHWPGRSCTSPPLQKCRLSRGSLDQAWDRGPRSRSYSRTGAVAAQHARD